MLRGAALTGDRDLYRMGQDLVTLALNAAERDLCPLGKIMGLYFSRLPAAVALTEEQEP
jgi:hypothetical protein